MNGVSSWIAKLIYESYDRKKTAPFINGGINRASFMALLAITSLIIILAGIATQSRMREPAQPITENINSNASVNHKINNPITALAKSGNNWSVKTTQNQPKNQLFYSADEPFRSSAWYKNVSLNGCNDTYIYPTPYIIKFSKKSLNIGTQLVNSNGSTIITKKDPDLIFEFTDEIKKCEVTEVSQLGAKFKLTNDKGSMTLNIVKGLAYIEITELATGYLGIQNTTNEEITNIEIIHKTDISETVSFYITTGTAITALIINFIIWVVNKKRYED